MDVVLQQLRSEGHSILPEAEARLSPFGHDNINLLGCNYPFVVPDSVTRGELRPSRNGSVARAIGALLMGPDGAFITGSDFLFDGRITAAY